MTRALSHRLLSTLLPALLVGPGCSLGEEEVEVGEEDKNEPIWALSLCLFVVFDLLLTLGCHHGTENGELICRSVHR